MPGTSLCYQVKIPFHSLSLSKNRGEDAVIIKAASSPVSFFHFCLCQEKAAIHTLDPERMFSVATDVIFSVRNAQVCNAGTVHGLEGFAKS